MGWPTIEELFKSQQFLCFRSLKICLHSLTIRIVFLTTHGEELILWLKATSAATINLHVETQVAVVKPSKKSELKTCLMVTYIQWKSLKKLGSSMVKWQSEKICKVHLCNSFQSTFITAFFPLVLCHNFFCCHCLIRCNILATTVLWTS